MTQPMVSRYRRTKHLVEDKSATTIQTMAQIKASWALKVI